MLLGLGTKNPRDVDREEENVLEGVGGCRGGGACERPEAGEVGATGFDDAVELEETLCADCASVCSGFMTCSPNTACQSENILGTRERTSSVPGPKVG